jgi:peptidoglycan/LPS O-acetylase OafA/YrhL
MLVVLTHSGLGILPGGFIGVDIFFVLSGYLITGVLLRELNRTGHVALADFYARRLRRLLPALGFMLLGSSVVALILLTGPEAREQLASAPYAATWTSNLYFAVSTVDYFDELAAFDLFLHTWSLGVEEQFYLVWPAVLLLLSLLGRALSRGGRGCDLTLPGVIGALVLSLGLSLYWTEILPEAAFYQMPSRVWQFSVGAVVYWVCRHNPPSWIRSRLGRSKGMANVSLLLAATFLFTGLVLIGPDKAYPGTSALWPTLAAALFILAGHFLASESASPLAHPVLVWIGDRSYSLYLWHWPVFVLGFSLGYRGEFVASVTMFFLTMVVTEVSYRFVEYPFWKGRFSSFRPRQVILTGSLITSSLIFACFYVARLLPLPVEYQKDLMSESPVIYQMGCDSWYRSAEVVPCEIGRRGAKKTVVLMGDSVGAQWYSMLPELYPQPQWRIIVLTKSSCPMVDEDIFYSRVGKIYEVCSRWRDAALARLEDYHPDILIAGSSPYYSYSGAQWLNGSARVFARLSQAADQVIVLAGTPSLPFLPRGCVLRNRSPDGSLDREHCVKRRGLKDVESVTASLIDATEAFANVHLLDLNELICPDGDCYATSPDGRLVFKDTSHIADSYVLALTPIIRERIEHLLGPDV